MGQRVSNSSLSRNEDYTVEAEQQADQSWRQVVKLGAAASTPSSPTAVTIGTSSSVALAANANRVGLILTNTSGNYISIAYGEDALTNQGITLSPMGVLQFKPSDPWFSTGAIHAIATGAGSNLAIQEFTSS